ncbi:hypothetical protein GJ496_001318 [Pomphorhynchus laevis]|nr:hypothetical protein GJ496_001318 [Pomphorhynchus laevis]
MSVNVGALQKNLGFTPKMEEIYMEQREKDIVQSIFYLFDISLDTCLSLRFQRLKLICIFSESRYKKGISLQLNNYKRYFDLKAARQQHASFILALRLVGVDVIELAASEDNPMCCFTGETAAVIDGIALLSKLKVEKRQKEVERMKVVLRREGLDVRQCDDQYAQISAGDILFTGKEIFVGLSNFTNLSGAKYVAMTYPDYPVNLIRVPKKHHLKYHVALIGQNTLVFGSSQVSAIIKEQILELSDFGKQYQTFTVRHDSHVGCISVNGRLFYISPTTCKVCSNQFDANVVDVIGEPIFNEFYKIHRGVQARVLIFNLFPKPILYNRVDSTHEEKDMELNKIQTMSLYF